MGAGHGHRLHYSGHSAVHRADPAAKVLALLGFVLLAVATPLAWWPVLLVLAALLATVVRVSKVPPTYLVRRMVVEVPVLCFAALLPFVASGPRIEVLGVGLSEPGLAAAGGLVVKATLGVAASLTLAATTEPPALLGALTRLRFPAQLVQIMGFMVRYLDVVTDDLRRMRVALASRGFSARDPRHWPVLARSVGVLFIRSYERGERVHLAMLSRGHGNTG